MTTSADSRRGRGLFDLALAASLGHYRVTSRPHSESDLRIYLRWCARESLDPLAIARADIERYLRRLR